MNLPPVLPTTYSPALCPLFFFFNDPAPPEFYPLSLHDALPISAGSLLLARRPIAGTRIRRLDFSDEADSASRHRLVVVQIRPLSLARLIHSLKQGANVAIKIGRAHV